LFSKKNIHFKILIVLMFILALALPLFSENAISRNKEGWNYFKRAAYDKALYEFTLSLRYNGKYVDSLIGAGKSCFRMELYDRALDMFKSALKIESNSVEALNGIGLVYGETGNFSEAIKHLNRAFKVSENKSETEYALARVYYRMGRLIWAKRKLDVIFKKNPFHYGALLLMADIKSDEKRYDEALKLILKAIESSAKHPEAHVKYGDILFKKYLAISDRDYAEEARESYTRALSIHENNYDANVKTGLLILTMIKMGHFEGDKFGSYSESVQYFNRALKVNPSIKVMYSLGLAYEMSENREKALDIYLKAYKRYPSDSLLRAKIESFLVYNDYKTGHPSRVMLASEEEEDASGLASENLHERVIFHLRKSLQLNPLNARIREKLISYYSILGYHRFFMDEIKNLLKLYPEAKNQDRLNLEVIKRRSKLYHREGYSIEKVPRNVPGIFVITFNSHGKINQHFDSGEMLAENLNFALSQFGRMEAQDNKRAIEFNRNVKPGSNALFESIKKLQGNDGDGVKADYLIFGDLYERDNFIKADYKIMDLRKGFIIYESGEISRGRDCLPDISMKIASAIFKKIPYKGKILKVEKGTVLVNLGLIDGVNKDSRLIIYRNIKSRKNNEIYRHKDILKVVEVDTYLCKAVPLKADLIKDLDSTFDVYPLKNRRAKLVGE